MMRIPSLFIFDMDGTMFDTEPVSYMCWKTICQKYGYHFLQEDFCKILGQDNHTAVSLFTHVFGPDFPYEQIAREKVAYQLEYYRNHDIPMKSGLKECLAFAREYAVPCAVASSSPQSFIAYLLAKQDLTTAYTIVQSGEEIARGKPAPDIFLTVCHKAQVDPAAALVLEDSENGILAAHAAHIPAVWIRDMIDISPDIQALAWRCCRSLAEIPTVLRGDKNL
ncbi:MAG: HAD family phosphatase [Megasphaera sp.]|jgi:beta-phosphoglucomutase-like phosphatase (HAD superfamily)|nr:HAD family phosphatase [Megasphaera sp.]MCI1248556.1 HAD family phosphatase [Megasphaera sp.]